MGQGESNLNNNGNHLSTIQDDATVQLTINNIMYKVSNDIPVDTSLNTFIRDIAKLKGTKAMCHEGGCGTCIVAAEMNGYIMSVNSCLVPVYICDGWKITTIEGIGDRKKGYHTLQAALADMNGSQCGFCSPGWVMNMFSLAQNGKMTMKEIENSFASNLCRCTGYRPILDTFKSFASDAPPMMKAKIKDIEELYKIEACKNCPKRMCNGTCSDLEIVNKSSIPRTIKVQFNDAVQFHKVLNVDHVFEIFQRNPDASYIINGGNTAHEKDSLILGANVTLSMAKIAFEKYADEPGFEYLKRMVKHIDLVASVPIRNIGTIAGNLMIKNQYHEFPSDIFLILEAAGAKVHLLDSPGSKISMTLLEFLNTSMNKKLIYSIALPALDKEYLYNTYKIMPRAQNAHAIVNAGFLFKLNNKGVVLETPNIIYGGIRPDFLHAMKTEEFFVGKSIFDVDTLKNGFNILYAELNPDHVLPDYKPEFRKLLAISLLYKYLLKINDNKVNPKLRSGGKLLKRELSSGKQNYNTDRNLWPVNQPITKIGSIYQTSGEGEYINDIITNDSEVFCVLTLAEAPGVIEKIEYEEAMDIDGVIAFYSAKDIPGQNLFCNSSGKWPIFLINDEILFADKEITYAGQAYGMIVAKSRTIAQMAASKVRIVYPEGPRRKPMVTVHDVIASNDKTRILKMFEMPAQQAPGKDSKHKIKGSYECGPQYHFHMETQTCLCVPVEDGMDVFSATQYMDLVHANIANVLGVQMNSINVKVRRLGGSYGAKISRATQIACACALACHLLNRPARLVMSIEDNMRMVGKRTPAYIEYDLTVDDNGKIQQLDANYWGNCGAVFNESHSMLTIFNLCNCYDPSTWNMVGYDVKTDLPSNTWCRAPGATEGNAAIEHIMERIARVTGKDPLDVKIINMNPADKEALMPMIEELKKTSDYKQRKTAVDKFNKENRWKKRGIAIVPMKHPFLVYGQYHSLVAIHARDGTVSVTTAGIEMGQGLHTKLAQIVAHTLGIDINKVSVKPSISLTSPNSTNTGGSIGSDGCGYAVSMACKELLKRLEPIKEKLGGNPSWTDLVMEAHQNEVDMCASHMFTGSQDEIKMYAIYGVTITEVEVDMLTGEHLIHRVDIMEDAGVSLSPKIDVGQVEGAFVMGIGYWTCEDLIYDPETGGLTNYRTWNYKIPGAKDIPVDFRVSFCRNSSNPLGILRSKATGEPPLCMSCSIPIAIRYALNSARADTGNNDLWYQLDNALTLEKILLNSLTTINDMVL
ncbi:xanthine dehydrogenase/oxidase-like isoform X2 [Phymastichus coffea]|uniref:xanthine dehydrogenase/oxidase-like isoform X2 n=1 Tax=Phymastichus coffea TaxID=108790 RepID=UPI00273C5873|nr:xanthine dehydrogenase/oxidase-like isoform X2 [Phymastichus coffea]